jgi:hypothetical protein
MKRIVIILIAVLAFVVPASALAQGSLNVTSINVSPDRHASVTWSGPYLDFGVVQIATQPSIGSDGDFFHENVITFDLLGAGQASWTGSEQIEHPGTYYLRVRGWDPQYQWIDFGYGFADWYGGETYSGTYNFTVQPICNRVVARRGYYTKRPHHKRVWHKPTFKTVCY